MKTYRVTIRATVTTTVTGEAENEDDACAAAHEGFQKRVEITGEYQDIQQEAIHIEEGET
jgi:hypothetical protein